MKKEHISDALNMLNDDIIEETNKVRANAKPTRKWVKWGAVAACLCLLVCGTFLYQQHLNNPSEPGGGQGEDPGGFFPEGVDPITFSIAVYPATESVENVASAEVVSLTESEALSNPLAEHLPKQLPDGFHYGRGSVYNTVMKDGTQYNMLRVEYITGVIAEPQHTEDGGVIAPDLEKLGELFTVCVMNYEPEIKGNIYPSVDEVTMSMFEDSGSVCVKLGDCYVIMFSETADPTATFNALNSAVVDKTADVINVNEVAELPQMLLPNLSEDTLIRKSSEEMFEYYGIDLADRLTAIGTFTEQGELHPHGFYFDGTFDLNWFAYASEDGTQEVLICIGKNTRAGEYLNSWYQSGASKSKIGGTEMYLCRYKDTSETCYYAVFELNGCELYVESFTADESGFVSMLKAIAAD